MSLRSLSTAGRGADFRSRAMAANQMTPTPKVERKMAHHPGEGISRATKFFAGFTDPQFFRTREPSWHNFVSRAQATHVVHIYIHPEWEPHIFGSGLKDIKET